MRVSEFLRNVAVFLDGGTGLGELTFSLRRWNDAADSLTLTDSGRELLADIEAERERMARLERIESAAIELFDADADEAAARETPRWYSASERQRKAREAFRAAVGK